MPGERGISRMRGLAWPAAGVLWIAVAAILDLNHPWFPGCALWMVWIVALAAYWHTDWHSRQGNACLAIVMAVVGMAVMLNLWWFTAHADLGYLYPSLINGDAGRNWGATLWLLDLPGGAPSVNYKDMGYSYVLWAVVPFLRQGGIVLPLMLNALAVMCTVILSGSICVRIIDDNEKWSSSRIGLWGMILCAAVCYILATGAILIKDALLIFAMTAGTRVALGTSQRRGQPAFNPIMATALWCIAVGLAAMLRNICVTYLVILLLVLNRRDRRLRHPALTVFMLIWAVACGMLTSEWLGSFYLEHVTVVDDGRMNAAFTLPPDHHNAIVHIFGDKDEFVTWPIWRKLLWMPVGAILQFFIPLPWNWASTAPFGPSQYLARIGLGWYVIGGLIVYYLVFLLRKRSPRQIRWLTICGVLMWLSPVYVVMGTVSRYALPFVPLLLPAALYAIVRDRYRTRFQVWMQWCILAIVVSLVAIYVLQDLLT